MKILFLNHFFYPYFAGTERHMLEVGKRLGKRHNVTVLTSQLKGTLPEERIQGMRIIRLPTTVLDWAPHPIPPPVPIIKNLPEAVKRCAADADVVHIHNRFIFGPKYGKIVKQLGKKLCLTIHNARPEGIDFLSDSFGQFYDDFFGKRLMGMCDGIIGVSKNALDRTIPRDYKGRTTVIYNGVDSKKFAPKKSSTWKEKIGGDKKIIMTNARLVPQKGVKYLVDAMQDAKLKTQNSRLVVFGRGVLKPDLEKRAKEIGADVLFISERISDESLVDLYAAADVFVLPSLFEPCPLVLLEAMACGKPIVATNVGGNPELIEDKKCGLLVPPANSDAIADRLSELLLDEKLAKKLGANARKLAVKKFTWDKTAKEVEKFYKLL